MEQDQLIQEISTKVSSIRTPLLAAGMKPGAIAFKKKKMEATKPDQLIKALDWLTAFESVYVADYIKVLKLVPQSVWEMYHMLGQTKGIHELDERSRITRLMKTEWRKRPACLNKEPRVNKSKTRKAGK